MQPLLPWLFAWLTVRTVHSQSDLTMFLRLTTPTGMLQADKLEKEKALQLLQLHRDATKQQLKVTCVLVQLAVVPCCMLQVLKITP